MPVRVRGYTLAAAPADVLRTFSRLARTFDGVFDGVTVRRVRRGDDEVATIVLMRVEDKLAGNRTVEQRILPGLVTGLSEGGKVTRTKVGRQQIAVAEPKGATLVAWYRKGLVVLVLGGDERAPVVAYSRGYVTAM